MELKYRSFNIDEFARDERFREWVIERDPSAEKFWTAWLAQNPDRADKIQVARAFLLALEEENTALSANALSQVADDILEQRPAPIRSLWPRLAFRIAASVLIVLGLGYAGTIVWKRSDHDVLSTLRQINPLLVEGALQRHNSSDRVESIRLEDGSIVQLYPNSSLRYPAHFASSSRDVYLKGKAFFKVTRNPKRPFWVYTNTVSTQVLGTSFLVSAFENAAQAKVEVKSGRVSVYRLSDVEKARQEERNERVGVILTPNQQVAYNHADGRLVKTVVPSPETLQPVGADAFVFEATPIADVFAQLEETYGLTVIYDPATMNSCYVTANLSDEPLFAKLKLICTVTRSTYELVDGQIIIHSNGCKP